MVASTNIPGVSITITINDKSLPEQDFPDLDPEIRTVNTLVEAQSEQVFKIQMEIAPETDFKGSELLFRVFVDGNQVDQPLVSERVRSLGCTFAETSLGCHVSQTMVRKYQFADITTVEQHSKSISSRSASVRTSMSRMPSASTSNSSWELVNTPRATMLSEPSRHDSTTYSGGPSVESTRSLRETLELGTIKVQVSHVNRKEKIQFSGGGGLGSSVSARGKAEAAKRMITQQVKFTAPEKTTKISLYATERVPGVPIPAATFIFHYRSKEGIKSMLAMAEQNRGPTVMKGGEKKPSKLESVEEEMEGMEEGAQAQRAEERAGLQEAVDCLMEDLNKQKQQE